MRITAMFATMALGMALLCAPGIYAAQAKPVRHTSAEQMGLTCAEIVQMSSTAWVTKFTADKGTNAPETVRGIEVYGRCYDERTNQIAAELARSGKGPSLEARRNFQGLEQALNAFTKRALEDSDPPADAVKSAYAALYEKQFRYEFYEDYEPKPAATPSPVPAKDLGAANAPASPHTPAAASSTAADAAPAANDASAATEAAEAEAQRDANASDKNPMTQAKNHFGDLLGDLPGEKELHESFGDILGPNTASPEMQLAVYRYAIFLLEPSGGQPFSPPPF